MGQIKNIKLHIVTDIKCIKSVWGRTNIFKSFTRRNKVIFFVSSSAFVVGSCVISPPSIAPHDPPVLTKHEDWGTEPNKGTSSTVCAYDVVAVRSLSPRVPLTVNQSVRVSTKSSSNVAHDPKLRRELVDWQGLCEYSTPTGYAKIPRTCTTK